ncbi:MAG: sugar O-acetyltransferase, partial [Erysipelotrichaceae bacterium]|nr:sugar O-acetyltransferase [Erysipelotrichaceae bacterium]
MSEKEKALAGLEFVRGDVDLKKARDRAEALCFELNQTPPSQNEKRQLILKELLPFAADGFFIKVP